jgi:hypothetical protein
MTIPVSSQYRFSLSMLNSDAANYVSLLTNLLRNFTLCPTTTPRQASLCKF